MKLERHVRRIVHLRDTGGKAKPSLPLCCESTLTLLRVELKDVHGAAVTALVKCV